MKKAVDVMNKEVITINKVTNLKEIISIMKEKEVGKIPVIENGIVVGVVTRDDILTKEESAPIPPVIAFWDVLFTIPSNKEFEAKLRKIAGYIAEDIMSTKYLTVKEDDSVDKIVTEILEHGYGYALVAKNGGLSGIITKTDLIKNSF